MHITINSPTEKVLSVLSEPKTPSVFKLQYFPATDIDDSDLF